MWQRVPFDWWMSAEWAVKDEQPILPTTTNPCITSAAGNQGVNGVSNVLQITGHFWHDQSLHDLTPTNTLYLIVNIHVCRVLKNYSRRAVVLSYLTRFATGHRPMQVVYTAMNIYVA